MSGMGLVLLIAFVGWVLLTAGILYADRKDAAAHDAWERRFDAWLRDPVGPMP